MLKIGDGGRRRRGGGWEGDEEKAKQQLQIPKD
jgi:hypothetical protein